MTVFYTVLAIVCVGIPAAILLFGQGRDRDERKNRNKGPNLGRRADDQAA